MSGGRQRTDATCVVAAVRELDRLELVVETLQAAALEALAAVAPKWLIAMVPRTGSSAPATIGSRKLRQPAPRSP